jgi:probable HAF family extracellular repeat protein
MNAEGVRRMFIMGCVAMAMCLPAWGSVLYTVNDLGTLGGPTSAAYGINNLGEVVGSADNGSGQTLAFHWSTGQPMESLGTLGGATSSANAINDLGQVVGSAKTAGGETRAFFWQSGSRIRDVGTLGGMSSWANDINNAGQIVGGADIAARATTHAFLYSTTGGMQDLGTLYGKGSSYATAVDSAGHVVGVSTGPGTLGLGHAFVTGIGSRMQDLGTGTSYDSCAHDINDSGWVAGRINVGGDYYDVGSSQNGNPMASLGTLYNVADNVGLAMNSAGQIVGYADGYLLASSRAIIHDTTNGFRDLNDLIDPAAGWVLEQATDLNNAGQIVGYGSYGGHTRAFLLTPIPEPALFLLFFMALLPLTLLAGKRRR